MLCAEVVDPKDENVAAAPRVPAGVLAAAERARAEAELDAAERRAHGRVPREGLPWIEGVRVKYGPNVNIVDLSAGGALIETERPLAPGSKQALEILGPDKTIVVAFGVVRSRIASLNANGALYRAACAFARPIDHPELQDAAARLPEFSRPARVPQPAGAAPIDEIVQEIDLQAVTIERDPPALAAVGPKAVEPPSAGQPAIAASAESEAPATPQAEAEGWNKIVVRFMDGTTLKGFTQDFVVGRPQFSLWPSIEATDADRVLVPLANLKAVFFVRDFEGQSSYRERKTFCGPTQGRRIQVTFNDGETLVGTTLGYRAGGAGFFVTPADPRANNARVFVISSAVRQVRFP